MMKRRAFLFMLAAALAGPAAAQDMQGQIVAQLKAQGATRVRVTRTLLGRVRILAEGPGYQREIIFNPRTGEILRDYWDVEDGARALIDPRGSGGPDDDGAPAGDKDDDGGDDDDEDDEDDDDGDDDDDDSDDDDSDDDDDDAEDDD